MSVQKLPSKVEERYRQSYLSADIKQAKLGILLVLAPMVLYLFNDYQFFGLSTTFYELLALRLGLVAFTIWLLVYFGRLKSYRSYDRAVFAWAFIGVIITNLINASRPQSFLFHIILVIALIAATYIVLPQKLVNRVVIALLASIGEPLIMIANAQSLAIPELFSVTLSLVFANLVGFFTARLLESYRFKTFKAQEEIADLARFPTENPDPVLRFSKNRVILYANPAAKRLFGEQEVEVGKTLPNFIGVDPSLRGEFEVKHGDKTFLFSTAPVADSEFVNLYGIDITERKLQEREIKSKSDEINSIFNGIGDILFVIDKNNVITNVNKTACDAFKKRPEELIGQHCYEIVHGTGHSWLGCPAAKTFETKQTVTEEVNDPNLGVTMLVTTSPIFDEQGEVAQVVHIAKDITKLKLAEMEMHFAANLFDAASDSILVHDLKGRIVFFNEAAHKLRGYSREEFRELTVTELEAPGNTCDFRFRMKTLLEKGEGIFETLNLRKDKTIVPFEIHARVVEFDNQKLVLSVARDVTERKNAEEKLRDSTRKIEAMNEKLRVSGSLTRHDVRNKLSTVTAYSFILKKKYADKADIVDAAKDMEQAVKDSMRIFEFAKMYEQLGVEELKYVNAEETINEAAALFSDLHFKIVNDCHGLNLLADSFLQQLFYNFIDNTRKYGVKTTTATMHWKKTKQDTLLLIYEDDGVGIPAANKPKLFAEGFSTGGSTGFGLFLIKRMMEVYGWAIQENGTSGKGVKFTITIPKINQNGKENWQLAEKPRRKRTSSSKRRARRR